MKTSFGALCAAVILFAAPSGTHAGTVTLLAHDREVLVEGDLLSADSTHYTVKTPFALVRIERSVVMCEGEACPALGEVVPSSDTELKAEVVSN